MAGRVDPVAQAELHRKRAVRQLRLARHALPAARRAGVIQQRAEGQHPADGRDDRIHVDQALPADLQPAHAPIADDDPVHPCIGMNLPAVGQQRPAERRGHAAHAALGQMKTVAEEGHQAQHPDGGLSLRGQARVQQNAGHRGAHRVVAEEPLEFGRHRPAELGQMLPALGEDAPQRQRVGEDILGEQAQGGLPSRHHAVQFLLERGLVYRPGALLDGHAQAVAEGHHVAVGQHRRLRRADLAQRQDGRAIQPDPGEDVIQQGGQGEVQRAVVEGVAVDGGRRAAAAELAVGLEELDLDPGARQQPARGQSGHAPADDAYCLD